MLEKTTDIGSICARDILTPNPIIVSPDALAVEALEILRSNDISQLVVSNNGTYRGIIHLHDLIREGIV